MSEKVGEAKTYLIGKRSQPNRDSKHAHICSTCRSSSTTHSCPPQFLHVTPLTSSSRCVPTSNHPTGISVSKIFFLSYVSTPCSTSAYLLSGLCSETSPSLPLTTTSGSDLFTKIWQARPPLSRLRLNDKTHCSMHTLTQVCLKVTT